MSDYRQMGSRWERRRAAVVGFVGRWAARVVLSVLARVGNSKRERGGKLANLGKRAAGPVPKVRRRTGCRRRAAESGDERGGRGMGWSLALVTG